LNLKQILLHRIEKPITLLKIDCHVLRPLSFTIDQNRKIQGCPGWGHLNLKYQAFQQFSIRIRIVLQLPVGDIDCEVYHTQILNFGGLASWGVQLVALLQIQRTRSTEVGPEGPVVGFSYRILF
jgi:hypothetical protein